MPGAENACGRVEKSSAGMACAGCRLRTGDQGASALRNLRGLLNRQKPEGTFQPSGFLRFDGHVPGPKQKSRALRRCKAVCSGMTLPYPTRMARPEPFRASLSSASPQSTCLPLMNTCRMPKGFSRSGWAALSSASSNTVRSAKQPGRM